MLKPVKIEDKQGLLLTQIGQCKLIFKSNTICRFENTINQSDINLMPISWHTKTFIKTSIMLHKCVNIPVFTRNNLIDKNYFNYDGKPEQVIPTSPKCYSQIITNSHTNVCVHISNPMGWYNIIKKYKLKSILVDTSASQSKSRFGNIGWKHGHGIILLRRELMATYK